MNKVENITVDADERKKTVVEKEREKVRRKVGGRGLEKEGENVNMQDKSEAKLEWGGRAVHEWVCGWTDLVAGWV